MDPQEFSDGTLMCRGCGYTWRRLTPEQAKEQAEWEKERGI